MIAPKTKPIINSDIDGNAFSIMGTVSNTLRRAGADKEYIDKYIKEATEGDYDDLLQVTGEYVDFY